ncbi:MAG: ribosome rescue GTPase HflX [Steroidobacteraceae bacterium]
MFDRPGSGERAILVCVGIGHAPDPDRVEEFVALARSAGAEVLEVMTATRKHAEPRFFLGTGKVEELRLRLVALGADLVVVDHALSPGQERNLEKELNCRVLDRSGLILDIFAQRARTFEGKLQVELAQLEHMSTRLVRGWTHLERQKGGIGLRGPGETQLETDRRLIAKRIRTLNDRLDKVLVQRETTRQERRRNAVPTVALVGYTNAGKSTLFNRLTSAGAYAADQLFATLDPTVRRLRLAPGLEVAVADTVGFVRDLPHELVAAFRSTLQEAREADLLLHVIDAADPERSERIAQVNEVLASIGADALPQVAIYNKIDRSGEPPHVEVDADGRVDRLWLSAQSGAGVEELLACLHRQLGTDLHHCRIVIPPRAGRARARLHSAGAVIAQRPLDDGAIELEVSLPARDLERICREAGLDVPPAIEPCAPAGGFLQSPGRATPEPALPAETEASGASLDHRPHAIGSN